MHWLTVHETVELVRLRHHVVGTSQNREDTERPQVDSDNSNDISPVLAPPSEQTEACGDNIDGQNGTSQLPRWARRPERSDGTSDENKPVLGQRDLQEQDTVNTTEVLDDTSLWQEHSCQGNPGTDGQDDTHDDRHTP